MPLNEYSDEDRWLVINGRRWRRTDPELPDDVVRDLTKHLGRARSAVGAAKKTGDSEREKQARVRVGLAKHGLGERGPYWWDEDLDDRVDRARNAVAALNESDPL